MDNRRNWNFTLSDDGSWIWQASMADGSQETSGGFPTLKACIADATEHGYVAWKTEEERRRDMTLEVTKVLSR